MKGARKVGLESGTLRVPMQLILKTWYNSTPIQKHATKPYITGVSPFRLLPHDESNLASQLTYLIFIGQHAHIKLLLRLAQFSYEKSLDTQGDTFCVIYELSIVSVLCRRVQAANYCLHADVGQSFLTLK